MADQSWVELDRTRYIWKKYGWFYRLLRGTVLIVALALIGVAIYTSPAAREAYSVNVFTSAMSAAATVLILDELNRRRSKQESENGLKRQLVDDAASNVNHVARNAMHQIRRKGWMMGEEGILKKSYLVDSSLQGAYMWQANFEDANLLRADLTGSRLFMANFRNAYLGGTNLSETELGWADFQKANLTEANLFRAELSNANLEGAILIRANLLGADLSYARFSESTLMPDGKSWTPETDIRKFTDPTHPDFKLPYWLRQR